MSYRMPSGQVPPYRVSYSALSHIKFLFSCVENCIVSFYLHRTHRYSICSTASDSTTCNDCRERCSLWLLSSKLDLHGEIIVDGRHHTGDKLQEDEERLPVELHRDPQAICMCIYTIIIVAVIILSLTMITRYQYEASIRASETHATNEKGISGSVGAFLI